MTAWSNKFSTVASARNDMETNNTKIQPFEPIGELVSLFQRGRQWYAHYRVGNKPVRRSLRTRNKKEARRKALAIERDLINGEATRPARAPLIKDVIEEYISHLHAKRRSAKTISKYRFTFALALKLAERRGISRINQIDLAFVDAFRLERTTHRTKPKRTENSAEGQTQNT